jgi:NAD(P)-dependent dehydrogenase (short-subunit alcohol dehydrogenase family)
MTSQDSNPQNTPRTAIILGATGGVGTMLTRRLTRADWRVALLARDQDRLDALSTACPGWSCPVDISKPEDLEAAFEGAFAALGNVGAVINCIGSMLLKPAHLTTDEEWQEVLDVNLTTAFRTVRAAVKRMPRGGSVVLVSSAAAMAGLPNHEAIAAAKAGINGLVASAAATYAPRGLRFNAVAPGLVRTPLTQSITENPRALAASEAMHPLGRIGKPEEIAAAIAWLIDPENSWVTGQVLGVDGGLSTLRTRPRQ